MSRYAFDCETNGFLDTLTKLHCLVLEDIDTGEVFSYRNDGHPDNAKRMEDGVRRLMEADMIIGHNIIKFDIPAIQKVYPWFKPKGEVRDTLVLTRLIWADIILKDFSNKALPKKLWGSHSLKAWGHRLKNFKGDFEGPWDSWSQEMQDYCEQDVHVTVSLWTVICRRLEQDAESHIDWSMAVVLEHEVAWIVAQQERTGVLFDRRAAVDLYATLAGRRQELSEQIKQSFPAWVEKTTFIPKANNKARGYAKGVPIERTKVVPFNPASNFHIIRFFQEKYGHQFEEKTEKGQYKVDEKIIGALPYPEANLLAEWLLVEKRISQLAEGKQAWLKKIDPDGRIRGSVITNGAVTGRATHSNPNLGQVPACGKPYGAECRALFIAPEGYSMLGVDVSGLELRCLAHFMGKWDGGAYGKILLEGDIHTANQEAAGLLTRAQAKTFIYAFLYGAGDAKIGKIIGKSAAAGKKIKKRFFEKVPALGKLVSAVQAAAKRGFLKGLDGRKLNVRSSHAALNTLLQSAGALICKLWMVEVHKALAAAGLSHICEQVLWVHDELQFYVKEGYEQQVGSIAVRAIQSAGDKFGIRIRLDGEFKFGKSWRDTH